MRYLLVLAGNSVHNREWGESCAEFFRPQFTMVFFPHYTHWTTGDPEIDIEEELKKVRETVAGAEDEADWYIFAKSIGSVLALKAIEQGIIKPEKCVFFGMPLKIAATQVGGDWSYLSTFDLPALAFHNDADPTAEYAFTKAKLSEQAPSIILKTLSGDTHDYLDFAQYEPEIKQFLDL